MCIPNLILVDATGHRLETIRRGPVCDDKVTSDNDASNSEQRLLNHATPALPDMPWMTQATSDFYNNLNTFAYDWTEHDRDFAVARNHTLHVARSGDVLYPIDETTAAPKTFVCLDIHGSTPFNANYDLFAEEMLLGQFSNALFPRESTLCQWCQAWYHGQNHTFATYEPDTDEQEEIDDSCHELCYLLYISDSTFLMREDIVDAIVQQKLRDTFICNDNNNDNHSWFPIKFYSLHPSPTLAKIAENVLNGHGFMNHPKGMPLKEF